MLIYRDYEHLISSMNLDYNMRLKLFLHYKENPVLFDRRLINILNIMLTNPRENFTLDLQSFLAFTFTKMSFFTCPASTKYHLNKKYGLLEHSLNVAETGLKLLDAYKEDLEDIHPYQVAFCGFFHDYGKAGTENNPLYLESLEPKKTFYYNRDIKPYMDVPHRSLYYLTKYFKLTQEEYQAILIHDGQYVQANKGYACKECPLALLIQHADQWSGFVKESVY